MSSIRFLAGALLFGAMVISGCRCKPDNAGIQPGEISIVVTKNETETIVNDNAVIDFEKVPMGTSPHLKLLVRNTGRGALDLKTVEKTSGANVKIGEALNETPPVFEVAFSETSLSSGEETAFDVIFNSPLETDASILQKDWEVVVRLNAENTVTGAETATITIKGTAISGSCVLPTRIDFGAVQLNDTTKQQVTVHNTSVLEAVAQIGQIMSGSGDDAAFGFATESITGTATIPAGGQRDIVLTFKPSRVDDYLAILKAKAADACPEVNITLVGSGVNSVLACDRDRMPNDMPTPLDFGYVTPTLTVQKELVLTNQGLNPIQLTNAATRVGTNASPDYKLLGPTNVTVPGAMRDAMGNMQPGVLRLPITFTPISLGLKNAALVAGTSLSQQTMLSCPLKGQGGGPDIDIKPAMLNAGRIPFFANAPTPFFVTRKVTIQNLGTAPVPPDANGNLRLGMTGGGAWTVVGKNMASTNDMICVGAFDETTNTCLNALPAGYDPAVGLIAMAGRNSVDIPIRITPTAKDLVLEWDVTFYSNDPDEAAVVVNVKGQSVELPPCNYEVTPTSLNFGLVTPPQYRDLTFSIRNLGMNPTETCLITHLGMKPGSDPIYTLPAGELDQIELQPGQSQAVTVRAWPMGSASTTVQQVLGTVTFGISSPMFPQRDVSLSASIATSCLAITPNDLNFGTVKKNCNSPRRNFSIYNTCQTAVTVNSWGMLAASIVPNGQDGCTNPMGCAEFFIDGSPTFAAGTQITSGGAAHTFSMRYKPLNDGPDTGAFLLKVTQNGQVVDYVVTVRGTGDNFGLNTDTFRQDSKPKADILLIVDSSGSMSEEQMALGSNFGSFIGYAQREGIDYHIGVTDTDYPANGGRLLRQGSNPKIITPMTPNVEQVFRQNVNVGTNGSGFEEHASVAAAALTAPIITNENAGFLRPDAVLAIIVVSDTGDSSPLPPANYENILRNVKGAQNTNMISFNFVGPTQPPPGPSIPGCAYDSEAAQAVRTIALVNAFHGVLAEICSPNWGTTLENIGKVAFGYRTNFYLTAEPDLSAGPVVVKIDHGDGAGAVILDQVDSRGAPVWRFDSVSNSVIFEPLFVPAPGDVMTVTYNVACL